MTLEQAEYGVRWAGGLAGLAVLAHAVWGMLRAQSRPAGRETGAARRLLQRPILLAATLLFVGAGVMLWRPLPLQLSPLMRSLLLVLSPLLYFSALALYLWGKMTLGKMFGAASGFGVRLQAEHLLITEGPYAFVRHPMYLAVIGVGFGGLLLYRTWAMVVFAFMMLGLIFRARREEEALALEFGSEWREYADRVPGWIPRLLNRSAGRE